MPLAVQKSHGNQALLDRYLGGGDLWVDHDNVTLLSTLVSRSGQDIGYQEFKEELPTHWIGRVRTRLFVPDEFFLKEGALKLLRSEGFMPATARVLTLVLMRLPELQRHFALLAFGTLVHNHEKQETVFCSKMSDFLSAQPVRSWLKQEKPRRVANLVRTYGGFAPGHAILGMKY